MPIRARKPSQDRRHFLALLLRLQAAGIATGTSAGLLSVPRRLDLRQLEPLFSRVHDLPGGQVVVLLRCELMALRAGATVRDCAISLPWGSELDLCDPEFTPWYNDVIRGSPEWPPLVLNRWLRGEVSLPRGRKLTGIIMANGWAPVPGEYPDDSSVNVELVLSDDQGNQLEFRFEAGVDRVVKRVDERNRRARVEAMRSTKRRSLFERGEIENTDQARTTPRQGRGLIPPSPAVVSAGKPMGGLSADVPPDAADEPMGWV